MEMDAVACDRDLQLLIKLLLDPNGRADCIGLLRSGHVSIGAKQFGIVVANLGISIIDRDHHERFLNEPASSHR